MEGPEVVPVHVYDDPASGIEVAEAVEGRAKIGTLVQMPADLLLEFRAATGWLEAVSDRVRDLLDDARRKEARGPEEG